MAKELRKSCDWLILAGMSRSIKSHWLLAMSLLCSLPGFAATVYKSVDENGVVSYSDTKPTDNIVVETLEIDDVESPENDQAQQRLQDMRDTTDRMAADRMAREKHRAELRELNAQTETQQAAQDAADNYSDYDNYDDSLTYTGYYNYPARPWRPPHHHRPSHPARPPLLPPVVRPLPSYDYPASLIRKHYPPKVREVFR